jgi:ABC-type phosphate transport system substrate-binding protein
MKTSFFKIVLVCAALLAGTLQAGTLEGVVVIANESVPVDSLSAAALKDLYLGRTMYWEGGQGVVIVVLPDDQTDAALNEVSGMNASQFKTFWQRLVFTGHGQLPKKAGDAASLVALVASTKGAIALAPAEAGLKGVKKIEIK